MYFIAALFSRQFLIPDQDPHGTFPNSTIVYSNKPPFNKHTPHMYFPLFTLVEIICYMGWVKVAGSLLNPFGGELLILRKCCDIFGFYIFIQIYGEVLIIFQLQMILMISISTT